MITSSGHDIAQDFYEHGYDVTLVQRSSTYVLSSKNGLDVLLSGLYEEKGPATEDADLIFQSYPGEVTFSFCSPSKFRNGTQYVACVVFILPRPMFSYAFRMTMKKATDAPECIGRMLKRLVASFVAGLD